MSGLALSNGSLLNVFQGKRSYQPVWQVIYTYLPPGQNQSANYATGSQLLVSDGQYLTYNVALHPHCSVTYHKNTWKGQNNRRSPEDIISSYRFPTIKVIDLVRKEGDHTTVLFLSKVKLMGWESSEEMPAILRQSDVEVVLGNAEVVLRSREGLENFEDFHGPNIEICEEGDEEDEKSVVEGGGGQLIPSEPRNPAIMFKFTEDDLKCGILAPMGPHGLDILKLCSKCCLLTYQESRISSFKPPTASLRQQLKNFLGIDQDFEFCYCDDENEQFRKEFQNKCMVVNQDLGPGVGEKKVQCILVSKEASKCAEHQKELEEVEEDVKLKQLTMVSPGINGRMPRVSSRLRLCERCGVEDTMMTACRQCNKVWYCTPACKRADVRQHSAVCRAYITVRRYTEERSEFASKLREPVDGCGNCGFWRDTLETCARCCQVSYCCYRCKDKAAEKHRPVCEAFGTIGKYKVQRETARRQEVD